MIFKHYQYPKGPFNYNPTMVNYNFYQPYPATANNMNAAAASYAAAASAPYAAAAYLPIENKPKNSGSKQPKRRFACTNCNTTGFKKNYCPCVKEADVDGKL